MKKTSDTDAHSIPDFSFTIKVTDKISDFPLASAEHAGGVAHSGERSVPNRQAQGSTGLEGSYVRVCHKNQQGRE